MFSLFESDFSTAIYLAFVPVFVLFWTLKLFSQYVVSFCHFLDTKPCCYIHG